MKYSPLILALLLSACGDDSDSSPSGNSANSNGPINTSTLPGTYRLSSLVCNGERLSIFGYQETLILSANSGVLQMSTENCLAKETFHFEIQDSTVFLESDKIECTITKELELYGGCHLLYSLNNYAIHHQCPSSFPSMYGSWQATQNGSTFTMTPDGVCYATYSKI